MNTILLLLSFWWFIYTYPDALLPKNDDFLIILPSNQTGLIYFLTPVVDFFLI